MAKMTFTDKIYMEKIKAKTSKIYDPGLVLNLIFLKVFFCWWNGRATPDVQCTRRKVNKAYCLSNRPFHGYRSSTSASSRCNYSLEYYVHAMLCKEFTH